MKRRDFVTASLASTIALSTGSSVYGQDLLYRKTPRDAEGPYYPVGSRDNDSNDLLANMTEPHGDILHFKGIVSDVYGTPVTGAVLDIWHTDPEGRYRHPNDPTPGARYDDFAYWGKDTTDSEGRFSFRTYIPAAYSRRPAHIHYKVFQDGRRVLTSQIYFRELGGTQGQSLDARYDDLRLASVRKVTSGEFETDFRIVV